MFQELNDICQLAKQVKNRSILELFTDANRADKFSVSVGDIFLDYSKQNICDNELSALFQWAENCHLSETINEMFSGEKINKTENRAVLHTALRASKSLKHSILKETAQEVIETENKMAEIVDNVCSGKLLSASGEKFTDVLAIGIGGSYYGIKVALTALKPYHTTGLNVHVLANVDGGAVEEKMRLLPVETTLVVVISKTFTTQETLLNATAIKNWMLSSANNKDIIEKQWFAISTNIDAVISFGLSKQHILPMWDWVGGRFSLWSAVGLPLALAIGNQGFSQLKSGAAQMDDHFKTASFSENMPVLLALLGIWNRNGLAHSSLAILPYDHSLRALPGYLQQTDMESNGKSVGVNGEKLSWQTAPVVFGQEGTNGQHAFMQLMHQSDDIIPTDFIIALNSSSPFNSHHQVLVANCFAQSEALMQGKSLSQVKEELSAAGFSSDDIESLAPHKTMKGNTPSNTLLLKSVTPKSFGALLALYEHKIFVQGALWQLNSFDQWGVELGKQLGNQILKVMDGEQSERLSSSSLSLISKFNQAK
ncbi:glucose-6-phosphate isomerase [Thalassotalea castellviae]|uniref:Glucose-6-phosphate isomerase n=1 Tax=Thalassotalea castellviae TaxID=3075612 RepID=A0ABU2ZXY5_9GAMM|nr:glucose-6-phosphate isomerase [Thalassotalea sp. W431]MDT0602782.1 glucose-6-phosphate isomerase [Thalassotalea sp. W431]